MSIKKTSKNIIINSTGYIYLLSLLFIGITAHVVASPQAKKKTVVDTMIVMEVNPAAKGEAFHEVTFRRSPRINKLAAKGNTAYLKILKESAKRHTPILVERARITSDTILSVKKLQKK